MFDTVQNTLLVYLVIVIIMYNNVSTKVVKITSQHVSNMLNRTKNSKPVKSNLIRAKSVNSV